VIKIITFFLLSGWISLPLMVFTQVTVVPGSSLDISPEEFINTYLLGSGVTVVPGTATFNGSAAHLSSNPILTANQIGTFTTTGAAYKKLHLQGGIVLCSGDVEDIPTGDCYPVFDCPLASTETKSGGDGDLWKLMGGADPGDKSILEFDFIPQTDMLTFRYVFASEEFDIFCGTAFNDAFGFLISGPGCGTIPPYIF